MTRRRRRPPTPIHWATPRERDLTVAAERFLDVAISYHTDAKTEESFRECHVCGEIDSHGATCPVAALELWLSS